MSKIVKIFDGTCDIIGFENGLITGGGQLASISPKSKIVESDEFVKENLLEECKIKEFNTVYGKKITLYKHKKDKIWINHMYWVYLSDYSKNVKNITNAGGLDVKEIYKCDDGKIVVIFI